ncbi:MAG TPA: PIN domain-containing protein [Longimicrobium sp.]|nr:PIN domain-containing protein [Longimicrobium sp.]
MGPGQPVGAVLDANVLYSAFLRDVLLRLAAAGLFQPYWTERIHEEWTRNLLAKRPDIVPAVLSRTRAGMDRHFPGALVVGFEPLEAQLAGVHPGDQHVAAAALKAGARRIVTHNLKHFPAEALEPYGLVPESPDDFVSQLIQADPAMTGAAVVAHRTGLQRPAYTEAEYAAAFRRAGLTKSASLLWP